MFEPIAGGEQLVRPVAFAIVGRGAAFVGLHGRALHSLPGRALLPAPFHRPTEDRAPRHVRSDL